MLASSIFLGFAAASAGIGATSEEPKEVEVRCFVKESDDGFIPRYLDAIIEQQENGVPIDPDLLHEISEVLHLCASTDEHGDKDINDIFDQIMGPPIAAELARRLGRIGFSTEKIDEIALDDGGVYRSPKDFTPESKVALAKHMALIDPANRERAVIYLILYIDTQATVHRQ